MNLATYLFMCSPLYENRRFRKILMVYDKNRKELKYLSWIRLWEWKDEPWEARRKQGNL